MTDEPQYCCICGRTALYKVNNLGFCKLHKLQAIEYKKQFPRENEHNALDCSAREVIAGMKLRRKKKRNGHKD